MGGARTSRLKAQGRSRGWCAIPALFARHARATRAGHATATRRGKRVACHLPPGRVRGAGHRSFLSGPYGDLAPRLAATAVTRGRLHGGLLVRRRAETPRRCVVARSSREVREGRAGARAGGKHGYFPPAGGARARDTRLQEADRRDSVPRWLRHARRRCVASKRHALQRSEADRRRPPTAVRSTRTPPCSPPFAPRLIQRVAGVRLRRRHYRAPSGDGWWRGKSDPCVVTRGAVLGRGAWIGILGCCSTSLFSGLLFCLFLSSHKVDVGRIV